MRRYIQKLIKNEFIKNFLTLLSGSVAAQGLVFLITPVLTRLYSDELFGVLTLFTAVGATLKVIITLRFELAILLPKRTKDAINMLVLNMFVVAVLSFVFLVIVLFFHEPINRLFKNGGLGNYIFLLPASVFLLGLFSAFSYWNNRQKAFQQISYAKVTKSVFLSATQLSIGYSDYKYLGLIPGQVFGQFVSVLHLYIVSLKSIKRQLKYVSFQRMLFLAKKYRDIPKFNTLISLTNTLSNELPGILLPGYFGLAVTGQFGLAMRIIKVPLGIVGQSVGQVFFNRASEIYNTNPIRFYAFIKKAFVNLLKLSLIIFFFVFVVSFFFEYILGTGWSQAGFYSRLMIPWLFFAFINSPISTLVVILNKQKTIVVYAVLLLIFRFLAIFLGNYFYKDIIISLLFYTAVGTVFNVFLIFYFLHISKQASLKFKHESKDTYRTK